MDLGKINKVCYRLKGIVDLMHDRAGVAIGDRKSLAPL